MLSAILCHHRKTTNALKIFSSIVKTLLTPSTSEWNVNIAAMKLFRVNKAIDDDILHITKFTVFLFQGQNNVKKANA